MKEKRNKKKHKRLILLLCIVLFVVAGLGFFQLGCWYTWNSWEHWYPSYERVDIAFLLDKETLTDAEYELLYRQTGVTKIGIDQMRKSEAGKARVLEIQEVMFSDITVKTRRFAPFTYMDEIDGGPTTAMCFLQDGDIIVSATTRVSWWRYGHVAMVVDGQKGVLAECAGPGEISTTDNVAVYYNFADFLILRPKYPEDFRKKVASYVKEEMMGVPYRFSTGILSKKYPEELKFSQCAHFVWYAYKKFGVDLDSNGGGLVKGQDMALSPYVEVVQAFGFDLDRLWS